MCPVHTMGFIPEKRNPRIMKFGPYTGWLSHMSLCPSEESKRDICSGCKSSYLGKDGAGSLYQHPGMQSTISRGDY